MSIRYHITRFIDFSPDPCKSSNKSDLDIPKRQSPKPTGNTHPAHAHHSSHEDIDGIVIQEIPSAFDAAAFLSRASIVAVGGFLGLRLSLPRGLCFR